MTVKIVSAAQHAMFEKAASDPAYAKQRGISQDLAREALETHKANGAPKLPTRVTPDSVAPRAAKGSTNDRPQFLTSHR